MRLLVFHYHLLTGGVTDVIVHSIQAVLAHRTDITSVTLVCGREENRDEVVGLLAGSGIPIDVDVVDQIGYTPASESADDARTAADRLQALLVSRYASEDAVWWVHNYHVGKNPSFTLALCRIACMEAAPRMVLHIHDFPECARYENLAYLNRVAGESPYPAGPTVRYAVINARDKSIMDRTGIPANHVHLLMNPLPPAGATDEPRPVRTDLAAALQRFAAENGQSFNTARPVLLYPVRTIRRKNVLEMVLLARLADDANLIVTLPGLSRAEKPYSTLVERAYSEGIARGAWGIGRREREYGLSFAGLARGSDVVVSSSVQEGFGLLFVNALRWRVPLHARQLSILEGMDSVFDGYPAFFHPGARVPLACPGVASVRKRLLEAYTARLDLLEGLLPVGARARLDGELVALLGGSTIDFSYLSPETQYEYLRGIDDTGFASDVLEINRPVVEALGSSGPVSCPDVAAALDDMVGFASFARQFANVVDSFDTPAGAAVRTGRHESAQKTIAEAFAGLEHLRLIFSPMGDHDDE